ncbi:MAG: Ig-like domain-containing protein [Chloroflexi bacterium]|nr:Ig-like domain-containing protein [Chloroflexota bacterium]
MRKVAAAALAVPVLAILYLPLLARRPVAARVALLSSVAIVLVVAAFGLSRPVATTATQASAPITALADDAFRSIGAATNLHAGVDITFSEAMDPRSVAASLTVTPAIAVLTTWNAAHTTLTLTPAGHWAAATYHTVTVAPGAMAATGRPMAQAARAAFVTRPTTSGRIVATKPTGASNSLGISFRITFDHPVATDDLRAALRLEPAVSGRLIADPERTGAAPGRAMGFTFTPTKALAAGTTYALTIGALLDLDGSAVGDIAGASITTSAAPRIVRVRPVNGTKHVDRHAVLSVRFSEPMNHATTRAAFMVTAGGKPVRGTYQFAESNTVLIFKPQSALPAGSTVVVSIARTATSVGGVPLLKAAKATIKTVPKAKAPAKATTTRTPTRTSGSSGGGAAGGGSWGAVETYYLRLMNCTRTGGWVTSSGSCSSPGGRNVAPLRLDSGISSKVSRPYAKKLAVNNMCTHFSGGNPGNRLSAAGYTSYIWAENLGCRSGNPYSAVLGSHLFFQSEKSYNGGHYVNLMNSAYDRCGIGVWVSGGRVRLVIDFYHPR